jgi:hypothetical protein
MKTYIGLPDGTNEEKPLPIEQVSQLFEMRNERTNALLDGMIIDQYIFMVDKRK